MKRILVIDDEQAILEVVKTILEDMDYAVETHSDSTLGTEAALARPFDLILVDVRMPGMNGAEVTEKILADRPDARVLLVTGYPGDPVARRALDSGAIGLMRKPFEIAKIVDVIEQGST